MVKFSTKPFDLIDNTPIKKWLYQSIDFFGNLHLRIKKLYVNDNVCYIFINLYMDKA